MRVRGLERCGACEARRRPWPAWPGLELGQAARPGLELGRALARSWFGASDAAAKAGTGASSVRSARALEQGARPGPGLGLAWSSAGP